MTLVISTVSSGHLCSQFKVILILLSLKEKHSKPYNTTFKRALATSSGRAFEVPQKRAILTHPKKKALNQQNSTNQPQQKNPTQPKLKTTVSLKVLSS